MGKRWDKLSFEECLAQARGVSRQALSAAIDKYKAKDMPEVADKIGAVRDAVNRERYLERNGGEASVQAKEDAVVVDATEKAVMVAEFNAVESRKISSRMSVTKDGRVWNHYNQRWTTPGPSPGMPYSRVGTEDGTFYLHRLVAEAFVPNMGGKRTVNHIDGNKQNNCASNLEWATSVEQIAHAYGLGLIKVGEERANSKLTADIIREAIGRHKSGKSVYALAREYGVSDRSLSKAIHGKTWKHLHKLDK